MWMYCYWIVIYLFIHLPIHLFIYSFVIIINWLLVKHSIFTSDFPEPPRHLVYFCVGWGGMVLMSWSEWRWRKGVSTMYCIMQVSMCGPGGRAVWAYVKHLNIFFFLGGGGRWGSNFRPLGLENGSNLIKCPEGTKEVFKLFIIILFIICIAPFLCPYQPHPPPPFLTLIYLHKERIYIPKLVSLYNMPL